MGVSRFSRASAKARQRGARLLVSLIAVSFTLCAPRAVAEEEIEFGQVLDAVVGIEAQVPSAGRTAGVLGTERSGSGAVIDASGLVVTIGYLILEASRVEIVDRDGGRVPAQIVAYDHPTGFGLLRAIGTLAVRPLTLGNSDQLAESDRVLIIGSGGIDAVQPAVVLSRRSFAGYWEYLLENAIFTAPPHGRFGGAALVGSRGELLGIGSLVVGDAQQEPSAVPGNMFVPINELKPVLGELIAAGRSARSNRPWLGVYIEEIAGHLLITRVASDGPAAKAGVEPGEIVIGIAGEPVNSLIEFYERLWAQGEPGVEVVLALIHESKPRTVTVRSGDRYEWLRLDPSL